jgi:hypothetical protein
VFDGTFSRSIAAGSGRPGRGAGSCGAAVVLVADRRVVGVVVAALRRGRAVRVGMGVVAITSTVGNWTGCCSCPEAGPAAVALATASNAAATDC